MKNSLRQTLLIALGISVGILLSFNLFGQNTATISPVAAQYSINSQMEYLQTVESVEELAGKLYDAHVKYPQLAYTHIYNGDGSLMGFSVTGVPQSNEADKISIYLMQLELLGNAVSNMDQANLPTTKNERLSSRVSKKKAMQSTIQEDSESTLLASGTNPNDLMAANK